MEKGSESRKRGNKSLTIRRKEWSGRAGQMRKRRPKKKGVSTGEQIVRYSVFGCKTER